MGTPEFALPALKSIILSADHNVKAVFTRAPKAQGRGMKLTNSPVHELAISHNIDVYTPKTLKNDDAIRLVGSIKADIIVVVAYGFIIPQNILSAKKYGCLNIHPSKLPKYRGAAPLQRTIIDGEKDSAVCIMQMDEGLDTGDIILQENFALHERITLQELHDKCAKMGGDLLLNVLSNINLPRIKQDDGEHSYANKLTKEEAKINWQKSAYSIDCQIRGMNPWPGTYFKHDSKIIKVLEANYTNNCHNHTPGEILNSDFEVACGEGTLLIKYVKPEGKSKMKAADYLRGMSYDASKTILLK